MGAHLDCLGIVYDYSRVVAILCGPGAGKKCVVGDDAMLRSDLPHVSGMVCRRLHHRLWQRGGRAGTLYRGFW